MIMSLIEVRQITKQYRDGARVVAAIDAVSFDIEDGDFVAITGSSGSGKSTLLTVLGVLNRPTGGTLTIDGIEVYGLTAERQADFRHVYIGFVFQSLHLIPYLSAMENVMLPLLIGPESRQRQREMASEVLTRVGLGEKLHRLPSNLSGGEQSRVAIARAIVNRPRIILADEPTGSLDSRTGDEIIELFGDLNKDLTIIMVTHDEKIQSVVPRCIHLRDGRMCGDGR